MNIPLITMTHVCRSWRNVLLSTPSLWTRLDFSVSTKSQQAEGFVPRSGNQLLDVHHFLEHQDDVEPFLSTTLHNISRLQQLEIGSSLSHLGNLLRNFSVPAPELKHLRISNNPSVTAKLPIIFGGRLPKLTSLSLHHLFTNLHIFNFPSLTRFEFTTGHIVTVPFLISFFERCPSLEFIQLCFTYPPRPPTDHHRHLVRLDTLKELRLDQTACTSGLLDHLILPTCEEMMLKGQFTGEMFDHYGSPAARIHPSSIDHLPVTRGVTKAVAMPNACVLSGPNGNLRFWCFEGGARGDFDAEYFTSFSPISVSEIRELWVGQSTMSIFWPKPWEQSVTGICGAFGVLTKVEDLTIVGCNMRPFSMALGMAAAADADSGILLPALQRLTVYAVCRDLDILDLIRCARARKEHSRPLGEVTIVFGEVAATDLILKVESLREIVGEVKHRVGEAPMLIWRGLDCDDW